MPRPLKAVWIGLVEVVGGRGSDVLSAQKGACFNALAVAKDLVEFKRHVRSALESLQVEFVSVEDAGRFPGNFQVPPKNLKALTTAAKEALRTGQVQFTTWHVYDL